MSQTQQAQQGQITIPGADAEPLGSIQQLLASNLGREVVAEFVTGIDQTVRKSGVLSAVQTDYLVLFDDVNLVDIVCDIYSLKFITFYLPGTRPETGGSGSGSRTGEATGGSNSGGNSGTSNGNGGTATDRTTPDSRETPTAALAALNYAKRKARKLD